MRELVPDGGGRPGVDREEVTAFVVRRDRIAAMDVDIGLGAGEPDFDTPENIKFAAEAAMRAGKTKYTATGGTRELQQSIIDFYAGTFGASYERNEVMGSSGGKQAIFNAVVSLINPGDEVIIPAPYWVSYPEQVKLAGGVPRIIPGDEANGFKITPEQLRKSIDIANVAFLPKPFTFDQLALKVRQVLPRTVTSAWERSVPSTSGVSIPESKP